LQVAAWYWPPVVTVAAIGVLVCLYHVYLVVRAHCLLQRLVVWGACFCSAALLHHTLGWVGVSRRCVLAVMCSLLSEHRPCS